MECRSALSSRPLTARPDRTKSAGRVQVGVEETRLIDEVRDAFAACHRTVEQDANRAQFPDLIANNLCHLT